jgi:Rrf2 family nitric oxide-sensitive transcriptional repressor
MQITHFTDYSLRVLIYLALREPTELITIQGIAEEFTIPRNHLIKVVQRLGQLGYVETARGKNGGIRLGRPPAEIAIGRVVRDMEANLEIIDCDDPPCLLKGGCRLKGILNEARDAFLNVLDGHTLAELMRQPRQYEVLLQRRPSAGR